MSHSIYYTICLPRRLQDIVKRLKSCTFCLRNADPDSLPLPPQEAKEFPMEDKSSRKGPKVLVAGAGIGGLVLALALLKKGFDVQLFERDLTAIKGEGKYRGPIQVPQIPWRQKTSACSQNGSPSPINHHNLTSSAASINQRLFCTQNTLPQQCQQASSYCRSKVMLWQRWKPLMRMWLRKSWQRVVLLEIGSTVYVMA